jgi:hypothetical protein
VTAPCALLCDIVLGNFPPICPFPPRSESPDQLYQRFANGYASAPGGRPLAPIGKGWLRFAEAASQVLGTPHYPAPTLYTKSKTALDLSWPDVVLRRQFKFMGHRLAKPARVAELADAPDLGSGGETRGGSSPPFRTNTLLVHGRVRLPAAARLRLASHSPVTEITEASSTAKQNGLRGVVCQCW